MNILIKALTIFGLSIMLTACGSTPSQVVRVEVSREISFPTQLVDCPLTRYPNPDTLTEDEVSRLIRGLAQANQRCRASSKAIQDYFIEYNRLVRRNDSVIPSVPTE
jgi:hypothetical protein